MKQKELTQQMNRIQNHIERKQIIPKAMAVAEKYGECKSETLSYRVQFEDKFSGKDYAENTLDIRHSGGWSDFGGEGLEICLERKRVFYADTSKIIPTFDSNNDRNVAEHKDLPFIKIGELYVHDYSPGTWEKQLALIYKNGPRKERKIAPKVVEADIEQSKLEELAARLPIKI